MKVELIGIEALEAMFERKMKVKAKAAKVIKSHGGKMQATAMEKAPVDTSFLKNSITLEISETQAAVESTAPYAVYQEYGTRYQPGTAHIRPAFQKELPEFLDDIKKVIK